MTSSTNLLLYLLALVSGSVGGAGAASWHVISGRSITGPMVLAYVVVGGVVGLFVDAWVLIYATMTAADVTHHVLALGLGSGFMATTGLVLIRQIAVIALKWRGVNLQVRFNGRDKGDG